MTSLEPPTPDALLGTIESCIQNGERLLEETYDLEFRTPSSSRFFLTMIAQEEFAKAFILFLVKEDIVPLTRPVLRAMNDHVCKQLVGMIMDYMIMHWDDIEQLNAAMRREYDLGGRLPHDIGSAMELLRYEKIGRWEANNWVWSEDPNYAVSALQIFKGKKDRRKQDALYVRIGRDGRVRSTPQSISETETASELERAGRYKHFVRSVLGGETASSRYDKAIAALTALFTQQD
ncbi:MAG: hypothetical protein IT563_26890 [Alphaproteobacteria bacterium]|nr:hypothetical protein [Alphaproteobacteria bacterium]